MKLESTSTSVEMSHDFEGGEYTIAATPIAFEALSTTIYSDSITAILRELGTNAADSHIAAGRVDLPFEVYLPNRLCPTFKIRDFGTGIKPEDIERIYKVYFASNKRHSDDYTGCLGLGSKTPFAYGAKSFTVVNYYGGTKYVYNAFINERGVPDMVLLAKEESQEPTGLEVSFPVNSVDFHSFNSKAMKVYQYFTVQPKIIGGLGFKIDQPKILMEGKGYKVLDSGTSYNEKSKLFMGNVVYPIQSSLLHDSYSNLPANSYLIIYADIGQVDFAMSREALKYTEKTNNFLKNANATVFVEILKKIQIDVDALPFYYDACAYVKKLGSIADKITYKGKALRRGEIPLINVPAVSKFHIGRKNGITSHQNSTIAVSEKAVFVYNDLPPKNSQIARLRQAVRSTRIDHYYIGDIDKNTFANEIGIDPTRLIAVSTLDKPVRDTSGYQRSYSKTKKVFVMEKHGWVPQDLNLKQEKGIAVPVFRSQSAVQGWSNWRIECLAKALNAFDKDIKIIGYQTALQKRIDKNPNLIPINLFFEVFTKYQEVVDLQNGGYTPNDGNQFFSKLSKSINGIANLDKDMHQLLTIQEYIDKNKKRLEAIQLLDLPINQDKNDAQELTEKVLTKYPLLGKIMDKSLDENEMEHIALYIELMTKHGQVTNSDGKVVENGSPNNP